MGFPGGSVGKESACNVGDLGSIPGLGRFPWRRERLHPPVFWPGESHGERSLAGYTQSMRSKSDMTLVTEHTHIGSKGLQLVISAQPKL